MLRAFRRFWLVDALFVGGAAVASTITAPETRRPSSLDPAPDPLGTDPTR